MQTKFFALSLVAVAFAAPAPAPEPTTKAVLPARQILGGGGGGVVGSIGGGFSGVVGSSYVAGCIGGTIGHKGHTFCLTETFGPKATEAPEAPAEVEERQIAGSLGGWIGSSIHGTLTGQVEPTLTGCIGGAIPFGGKTICLGALAKPTPTEN